MVLQPFFIFLKALNALLKASSDDNILPCDTSRKYINCLHNGREDFILLLLEMEQCPLLFNTKQLSVPLCTPCSQSSCIWVGKKCLFLYTVELSFENWQTQWTLKVMFSVTVLFYFLDDFAWISSLSIMRHSVCQFISNYILE